MEMFCDHCLLVFFLLLLAIFHRSITTVDAYDPLDPYGNITVSWDIMSWTSDGYVAMVTLTNYQRYRHVPSPGWRLGWTWAKKEVLWAVVGAQAMEQGDCSRFKQNIPHCCKKDPMIVDLLPGVPYNKQVANCCKGGVLTPFPLDPLKATSSFQVSVGNSGSTNTTVKKPAGFVIEGPALGYSCSSAELSSPTKFISYDGRRVTQALMTWKVTCIYSQFIASNAPTCCVSLSSFYNDTIVRCPACSCGCLEKDHCVDGNKPKLPYPLSKAKTPLIRCTRHMCPIKIHWHLKLNYKEYWRAKVTVTNFNYGLNYSDWNLVMQHPGFKDILTVFSFNYTGIGSYGTINDTALFWGIKYFNEIVMQAGPMGDVQTEILIKKDKSMFTLNEGWGFPQRVYFNGNPCVMPLPDAYPRLPNSLPDLRVGKLLNLLTVSLTISFLWVSL